jgi:hypothetical protein
MFDDTEINPAGALMNALFMGGIYLWGRNNGQKEVVQSYEKMETERKFAEMQAQIFYLKKKLEEQGEF